MDAIPDTLGSILQLAAILMLLATTSAAIISTFFTRQNGLLYLGSQLTLLLFMLYISDDWVYRGLFHLWVKKEATFYQTLLAITIMSAAFAANVTLKVFLWESRVFKNENSHAPGLLIGIVQALIYLLASLIILQFVYGHSITALATLSGAAAVVLGFSAQSTLGEMFAGIALTISRPFKIGDWIQIGTLDEGKVIDQTWRHVKVRTWNRYELNINNSVIAQSPIKNFSMHPGHLRVKETLTLYSVEPHAKVIERLMEIFMQSKEFRDPAPEVFFVGSNARESRYEITYILSNYAERSVKNDKLLSAFTKLTQQIQESCSEKHAAYSCIHIV